MDGRVLRQPQYRSRSTLKPAIPASWSFFRDLSCELRQPRHFCRHQPVPSAAAVTVQGKSGRAPSHRNRCEPFLKLLSINGRNAPENHSYAYDGTGKLCTPGRPPPEPRSSAWFPPPRIWCGAACFLKNLSAHETRRPSRTLSPLWLPAKRTP